MKKERVSPHAQSQNIQITHDSREQTNEQGNLQRGHQN